MSTRLQRIVIKVGASVLTDEAGRLLEPRLTQLTAQLAACARAQGQPILVSSGAIACGMARLGVRRRPTALAQLQACAAVGQGELMAVYSRLFAAHGLTVAQLLLTEADLADQQRFRNAKQTLLTLLHRRVVPIINENDTVAVDEITFGDNDRLAALVASAIDAQLLLILTDVDGLLRDGQLIERVEALDQSRPSPVGSGRRQTTKGGITSKLEAARMAGHDGIPMVLANGTRPNVVTDLLAGQPVGTLFVPPLNRLSERKWWIAFSLRRPKGEVIVDAGAVRALAEQGRSLLPSGIVEVKGRFEPGACVHILDEEGREIARGVCNFSSADVARIKGLKSAEAAQRLGQPAREVIHRDHMVLARELQGT